MTVTKKEIGFKGEVSFAKEDDYIRSLVEIHVDSSTTLKMQAGDAASFAAAATVFADVEAARGLAAGRDAGLLLLTAVCEESTAQHRLDWLNVTERKQSFDPRSCHELYIVKEGEEVVVTFEHGEFGYRRERHTKWSTAFARVAQVMAGDCSWTQFGDIESRNTMLGKGQFYWEDQQTKQLVPVDNFVFRVPDTLDIRLSGVSHRCALDVEQAGYENQGEWYADYSEGLRRIADIFDGAVDMAKFGEGPDPELCANAPGKRAPRVEGTPLASRGRFFVETIYRAADVHAAPVLVYQTAEGKRASLHTTPTHWHVKLSDGAEALRTRTYPTDEAGRALRTLADVLKGTLALGDF